MLMMNTFIRTGFIFAVSVMLSAGCKNTSTGHTPGSVPGQDSVSGDVVNGPYEEYRDSVLVARGSYKNGKKTGSWTYWYPNGQIKAEGHYRKGKEDGMWVQWYDDGEMMWKGIYDRGKRNIDPHGAAPGVKFLNATPDDGVLNPDSVYIMQIRIPNVPSDYLFIEVSSGTITMNGAPDQFICHPPGDSSMTLLIGYYPDKSFTDFRNLVAEMKFSIDN